MIPTQEYLIKGLITEQVDDNETRMKKVLMDFYNIIDGTFSFGTGIGAFLGPVRQLLSGQDPTMGENQIILLYITAMWLVLRRHSDKVSTLLQIIKDEGLMPAFAKVTDFLRSLEDVSVKVTDEVGYTVSSLADVTAFTFFAMPLLDVINQLISTNTINLENGGGYLKSVLISIGVIGAKNVFNILIDRLKGRLKRLGQDKLNEEIQSSVIKKKVLLDTDKFKVYVPLKKNDICIINDGKWCNKDWEKQQLLKWGTNYVVEDKKNTGPWTGAVGNLILMHHNGKIPFLRDGDNNYTLYDSNGERFSMKSYMSHIDELKDFFKLSYTLHEFVKYDIPFTDDDIKSYSETNDFSKVVFDVATGKKSKDELYDFTGEELGAPGDGASWMDNTIEYGKGGSFSNGITLKIKTEDYEEKFLNLDPDDEYYFHSAMESYYDSPYEEVDSEELNYMSCWYNDDVLEELIKLMEHYGLEVVRKNPLCHSFEDGEIDEFLEENFADNWHDVSSNILTELGYGLAESRAEQTKEHIKDSLTFDFDKTGHLYTQNITYNQLLFLIKQHDLKDFSDLFNYEINETEGGLSEVWHDTFDWGDETSTEINRYMGDMLDRLLDEWDSGELQIKKKRVENVRKIVNSLDFGEKKGWGQFLYIKYVKELDKTIRIVRYDVDKDELTISIGRGDNQYAGKDDKKYVIKPSELSNYVLSEELF